MANITFNVEYSNGEKDIIHTCFADQVKVEAEARNRGWKISVQNDPLSWLSLLAYSAAARSGNTFAQNGYDSWLENVADLSPIEEPEKKEIL